MNFYVNYEFWIFKVILLIFIQFIFLCVIYLRILFAAKWLTRTIVLILKLQHYMELVVSLTPRLLCPWERTTGLIEYEAR
jgi:hypothetical protein